MLGGLRGLVIDFERKALRGLFNGHSCCANLPTVLFHLEVVSRLVPKVFLKHLRAWGILLATALRRF